MQRGYEGALHKIMSMDWDHADMNSLLIVHKLIPPLPIMNELEDVVLLSTQPLTQYSRTPT